MSIEATEEGAAPSSNEITDNKEESTLFFAVQQSDNERVHALIKAGADVNITDKEGKTALFYAVQQSNNESVVRALVEQGNSLTSPRDIYGRTPLFYAMTAKSKSIIHCFLEKKVNMRIKDICGMSFVSFFVDFCISKPAVSQNKSRLRKSISERIDLIEKRVKINTVYEAIIGIIFCKCPLLLIDSRINVPIFNIFLKLAKTYTKNDTSKIDAVLKIMLTKTVNDKTLYKTLEVPQILHLLCELGADPNSADKGGNTALHYATCLPFYGVSKEAIMDILKKLEEAGVTVDAKNHQSETPLLFCLTWLSNDPQLLQENCNQLSAIKILVEVCHFLMENGSNVEKITDKGETVLHLIMRLLQKILEWHGETKLNDVVKVGIELFISFSSTSACRRVINRKDENLNLPIHLWASLEPPHQCLRGDADGRSVFSGFIKEVLNKLLECETQLDERNEYGQTPVHLCRTWSAVELLIDSRANPNVVDLIGRSPLIVAAQKTLLTTKNVSFYPDVELDPKAFWKTALEKGLDPWIVDEHGDSVLSILIESEAVDLAKAMIDVFCANRKDFSSADEITHTCTILNILCKDNKPAHAHWKREYVAKILVSLGKPLFEIEWAKTSPLHSCCRNIVEASRDGLSDVRKTVHWAIAELLLSYKADCKIPDETDQSCLNIAEVCPELNELLNKQIAPEQTPNFTRWKPERCVAKRHVEKLKEVSKSTDNCVKLDQSRLWYHKDPIEKGSFGCKVFAGISVEDGMEVAVKRVCRKEKKNCEQEIDILVKLSSVDRQQLLSYYRLIDSGNYLYIILELMEGDLSQLLNGKVEIKTVERKSLCQQLLKGVHNMHETGIIHRHLRPTNILILNRSGQRQLKIAGFGLSCDINSSIPFPTKYKDDMASKSWSAPEVLLNKSSHSKESDMFSCGLVLHYIKLKKHPYAESQTASSGSIVTNIQHNKRNKWDPSLCPEFVHVLENILKTEKRSTAKEVLGYPLFWSDDKKVILLKAVSDEENGNPGGVHHLECRFKDIVKCKSWDINRYNRHKMPEILRQMTSMAQAIGHPAFYYTKNVRGLLRLIRNAHAHIVELINFNEEIGILVSEHVFLKYFPNLVVEVFKAIKVLKWDVKKSQIKCAMNLATTL